MARLTKAQTAVIDRAHCDPKFRVEFLKEFIREAIKVDPKLIERVVEKIDSGS
jgi:hypothetical protein